MTWKRNKHDRSQTFATPGVAPNQVPSVEWLRTLWFAGGSAGIAIHVPPARQAPQDPDWLWLDENDEQIILEHTIM